jgi:hypothetical protein
VLRVRCNAQLMPPTLTVKEAAELAGCGVSAAYEACRQARWPALRITERRIVVCTVPFLQMLGLEVDQGQVAQGHDPDHALSYVSEKEGGAL